jgi:hypothetical protein
MTIRRKSQTARGPDEAGGAVIGVAPPLLPDPVTMGHEKTLA